MSQEVRVRFAPSPTGPLHIGGVRTALYNYLFAKKHNGSMLLRIEDTDQARYVEGAEDYIKQSLAWCGIIPDEGPDQGGQFGPYRQSERKGVYQEYVQKLLDEGKAYYAFDTPAELDAMREKLKAAGVDNLTYNSVTRMTMNNSLTLSAEETASKIENGEPYVVRVKIPSKEEIRMNDLIRGWVMVHSSTLDDKVLMKSGGLPTYHLANVVDDHLMKITHVIRGEEWLPSAPLHALLYQFLGWGDETPQFAHLPLLLKPDGNGKLSKRDGDKHGFPVFPITSDQLGEQRIDRGFREDGYLKGAFVNFLALLGWNPGGDQELFSMEELIAQFSLERINKAGAKFDIQKAKWFNEQYLRATSDEVLAEDFLAQASKVGINCSPEKAKAIVRVMKERVTFSHEILEKGSYFFDDPAQYDDKIVVKKWTAEAVDVFAAYANELNSLDTITVEEAKSLLSKILEEKGVGMGRVMQALRVAMTGGAGGPDLMDIIEIVGPATTARRINIAIEQLPVKA
ncbi:MAG: glutamate--tRNA ligase [Cyclobacteriaceae bacterium]